jgi:hypothetical protein
MEAVKQSKAVPLHAMLALGGRRIIAPTHYDLGIRWDEWSASQPDGSSTHLSNICLLLRDYTAPYCKRLSSSYSLPREPEISFNTGKI